MNEESANPNEWKKVPGGPTDSEVEHWGPEGLQKCQALHRAGHNWPQIRRLTVEQIQGLEQTLLEKKLHEAFNSDFESRQTERERSPRSMGKSNKALTLIPRRRPLLIFLRMRRPRKTKLQMTRTSSP